MKTIRKMPAARLAAGLVAALVLGSCTLHALYGAGATADAGLAGHYESVARVKATIVIQPEVAVASHGEFFGVPVGGDSVAYVIDTSGSMSSLDPGGASVDSGVAGAIGLALLGAFVGEQVKMRKIDVAKSELMHSLDSLPPHATFNLRAFNDEEIPFYRKPVPATPENLGYARTFVDGLSPEGGTVIIDSLEGALSSGVETVVLLSDGLPNDEEEPSLILQLVQSHHDQTGVVVHVIGLGMGQDDVLLSGIATRTGGAYAVR